MTRLQEYCEQHTSPQELLLYQLERATHLRTFHGYMSTGHLAGKFLEMVSCMIQPAAILEIGTFTGYSALCLAKGLRQDGVLHTFDINEEYNAIASEFIGKSPYADRIKLHLGDLGTTLAELNLTFDLAFIDGDKQEYREYYELTLTWLREGGFMVIDNTLWKGQVLHPGNDASANAVHDFNEFLLQDTRVEQVLLPVRDGMTLVRKVSAALAAGIS